MVVVRAAHSGHGHTNHGHTNHGHTNKEKSMNTHHNKLALRRQSIRTLTAGELRFVAGGRESGGGPGPVSTAGGGETHTTGAKVRLW